MTFLGFIVAVLIIGGIFYAWYAYAGRGAADTAQGANNAAQGARQMRTSTAMETGTIGELPEDKQGKHVEGNTANSGYIPRNVLNPDQGYDVETGTIGETQAQDSSFEQPVIVIQDAGETKAQAQTQTQAQTQGFEQAQKAAPGTTQNTAVGATNATAGNATTGTTGTTGGEQDLTSAIHQAFREEFYNMDDNDKTH